MFVIVENFIKLGYLRHNEIKIKIKIRAINWPISTPILNPSKLVNKPSFSTLKSCNLLASPKPWNYPKFKMATFILGCFPNKLLKPPKLSKPL